jgi:uncharacterized membrane protein YgaE (UPF0421/DUF939 family)
MTTATLGRPLSIAGVPMGAWAFGIRIWLAVVVALLASFWLELEAPSSAAVTVAILAVPTRGQALDKAVYRSIATLIGVTASLAITGIFSQTRDLLLAALAGWTGLCVYAAGLMDGTRAYAAVLSGYTVALIAIQQLDTPEHVFEGGMARGAAIAVGIVAIAIVNDVLAAPDNHPQLASRLAALHGRVRDYANAMFQDVASDTIAAAGLLRDIAALPPRPHEPRQRIGERHGPGRRRPRHRRCAGGRGVRCPRTEGLAPDGRYRHGGARPRAARRPGSRWPHRVGHRHPAATRVAHTALSLARDRGRRGHPSGRMHSAGGGLPRLGGMANGGIFSVVGRRRDRVGRDHAQPQRIHRHCLRRGPDRRGAGGHARVRRAKRGQRVRSARARARSNPVLASLGRLSLVFMLVIFAPSNPPAYDPQSFLFTSLFLCVGIALLLAAQMLIPTESSERRQNWILTSARRDFERVLSRRDRGLAPEEAMFRDATRIAQIPASATNPRDSAVLAEALSYFDRAAAIRLARAQEVVS